MNTQCEETKQGKTLDWYNSVQRAIDRATGMKSKPVDFCIVLCSW